MKRIRPPKIPVYAARNIAKLYGYDQIIIVGRCTGNRGYESVTTYGKDKEHCKIAAMIGHFLKHKIMKWGRRNKSENRLA